jgi:hypothetical protein
LESLTPAGWVRARALPRLFNPVGGVFVDPRLARPLTLFASTPNAVSQSVRSIETLTPLSRDLGLGIDETFGEGDGLALVNKTMAAAADVVLIAWHHEEIPKIGQAIAPLEAVPAKWRHERFDLVWVFHRRADATWSFHQAPQSLMPDDKPV